MPKNKDKTQENKCESKFLETPRITIMMETKSY